MTAGLVAAGAICAVAAAKFVQNDVVEVEAKTPQQIEPETSTTSISDISGANSAFDAITLDLSGSDSSEEDDVELVLDFSETNESLVEGLTESSGRNRFPGAARADLEWLRRSGAEVPSAPRNAGVVTESALEWYPAAR